MGYFVSKRIPAKKAWNPFTGEITDLDPIFVELNETLERLKTIGDDEKWWLDLRTGGPPTGHRFTRLADEKIKRYWNILQVIYDNRWCRELCSRSKGLRDPYTLLGMVQSPLTVILRLGECVSVLGGLGELPRELLTRLKNPKEYPNALLELEIAACFKQANLLREMYPVTPEGRRPEGLVRVGKTDIYYEFIRAGWTKAEQDGMLANAKLSDWLIDRLPSFAGSINFKLGKGKPSERVEVAIATLEELLKTSGLPVDYNGDVFTAKLIASANEGSRYQITGLEPPQDIVLRQWVKRIFSKYNQLVEDKPGVIIAHSMWLWGPEQTEIVNKALIQELSRQPHTRVSGIIFHNKSVEHSGFIRHYPVKVVNPLAKTNCQAEIEIMCQALWEYPDWL